MPHFQFALCLNAVYTMLGLLFLGRSALGLHNETVDNTSPRITYTGIWSTSDRFNSTKHHTKVQGSYATLSFTGAVAVAYIGFGHGEQNVTTTDVIFDGKRYHVDQGRTESSERPHALIWNSGPIDAGKTHTIVCMMTNVSGNKRIIVDAFILSIPEAGDAPFTTHKSTRHGASVAASPSHKIASDIDILVPITVGGPYNNEDGAGSRVTITVSAQSTNTPEASPTDSNSNRVPVDAIAGGVAGVLAFISLLCIAGCLLWRYGRFQLPRPALAARNVEDDDDMEHALDTQRTADIVSVEVEGSEVDSEERNSSEKPVPSTLVIYHPMVMAKEQRGRSAGAGALPQSALGVGNVENDSDRLDTQYIGDIASVDLESREADGAESNSTPPRPDPDPHLPPPVRSLHQHRFNPTDNAPHHPFDYSTQQSMPQSASYSINDQSPSPPLQPFLHLSTSNESLPLLPSSHLYRRKSNELFSSHPHRYTYPSPDLTRPHHQNRDQDGGGESISVPDTATGIFSGQERGALRGNSGKARQRRGAQDLRSIHGQDIRQDDASGSSAVQGDELTGLTIEHLMERRKPEDLTGQITIRLPQTPFHGGYGFVYVGIFRQKKVAVKIIEVRTIPQDENIDANQLYERRVRREINIWAALKHPNICEFLGYTTGHSDYYAMVSPWCDGQTATQYLGRQTLSVKERVILAHGVSKGLQYMHNLKVIHGDIKTMNVLVDKHGVAKLCDFGLARLPSWQRPAGMTTTTPYTGTTAYKAPELFISVENRFPVATFEGDIYSLGCIMLEFIERLPPFKRPRSPCEGQAAIRDSLSPAERSKANHALGPDMTERFWDLLEACWKGPTERPSIHHIVEELDFYAAQATLT